jgi:hypothetical protein
MIFTPDREPDAKQSSGSVQRLHGRDSPDSANDGAAIENDVATINASRCALVTAPKRLGHADVQNPRPKSP